MVDRVRPVERVAITKPSKDEVSGSIHFIGGHEFKTQEKQWGGTRALATILTTMTLL